jgi:hypothetical protein
MARSFRAANDSLKLAAPTPVVIKTAATVTAATTKRFTSKLDRHAWL